MDSFGCTTPEIKWKTETVQHPHTTKTEQQKLYNEPFLKRTWQTEITHFFGFEIRPFHNCSHFETVFVFKQLSTKRGPVSVRQTKHDPSKTITLDVYKMITGLTTYPKSGSTTRLTDNRALVPLDKKLQHDSFTKRFLEFDDFCLQFWAFTKWLAST